MFDAKLIKYALATVMAAAGVFSFSAYADGFAAAEPADSAAPAPEDTTAPAPYAAPRYFNPTPRQDNPTDSPGTWEVYPSPTGNDLYCVDFVDVNNGWAGGRSVALRYRNGTWSVIPGHSGHVFSDIDMLSLTDGWAVGWDGNKEKPAIWRWNGSDWREFQNPTGAVYCIDMINNAQGWIGGNGYFLRYNGSTWVWGGSSPNVILDIQMNSDTDGRALGYHYIMRKVGNNWVQEAASSSWNLGHIYMLNNNSGWASGQYLTTEKGMVLKYDGTWRVNKIFVDVYCVYGIWALNNNSVWASGPKKFTPPWGGTFLYYDGSGWVEVKNPDPGENVVNKFLFLNEDNGWGVGSGGRIWRYKLNVAIKNSSLGKIKAIYR